MRKAPVPTKTPGAEGEQLSFLPPPPFCPAWPRPGTNAEAALDLLMRGQMLDHLDFIEARGCWRLAAHIAVLKDMGWPIERIDVPSPTDDDPGRVIALYHLPGKYVALAQELKGGAHAEH